MRECTDRHPVAQTDQALERRETLDGGELGPESLLGVMVTQVS